MVAKRLARHADVIVDVDAGTVERRTPLARPRRGGRERHGGRRPEDARRRAALLYRV